MAVFEIQGQDGKIYEVDAPDIKAAAKAMKSFAMPTGGASTNSGAIDEFKGKMASGIDGAIQGVTFGLGDEMAGVRGAVLGQNQGPDGRLSIDYSGTMGDRYASERDKIRAQNEQSRQQNPMQFGAGQILGATVPAALAAPLATGSTALQTVGRSAALGGVEGALQGAGNADGQDLAGSTIRGALVGTGLGAAAPMAVGAATTVGRAAANPVTGVFDTLTNRANQGKANRAIMDMMQASGKPQDEISDAVMRAAQQGQPEFRMMDAAGIAGQRLASGVARSGGESGAEIADFLSKRQAGQGERVAGFVDEGFGMNGTTAAKETDRLTSARRDTANSAYDAARGNAAPVDIRGALGVIDSRIGGMQGSGVAGDGIDSKLSGYRSRLAAQPGPDGVSRELSDFDRVLGVKQSIQDDIGAAVRAGRNNEARELGKLMAELDAALESSSNMYRAANDGFRDASRVIGAVDDGAAMSRPSARSQDTTGQFSAMNPAQQSASRVGYGDQLLSKIEANASPTANKAKLLQSPKRDAEAQAMTLDPELYGQRLGRENEMWETQNRALGGSRTADNEADKGALAGLAGGTLDAGRSAMNFQFGDAISKIGAVLGPIAKGQNEATRKLIAKALMSDDPAAVLAPALRQDMGSKATRRYIEAVLRQTMRPVAEGSSK